ncbi:hypothetical protein NDU88_003214 [Pleurodeles waltl]|uniref:Uncharacterized protein n=1 Tax=Pleurodeles waltl TaxID=8319 RepID=A0AAV7NJ90_PLEWA|nr:hypothetical protein NDU88_003214 [Pleurodeles waltl]
MRAGGGKVCSVPLPYPLSSPTGAVYLLPGSLQTRAPRLVPSRSFVGLRHIVTRHRYRLPSPLTGQNDSAAQQRVLSGGSFPAPPLQPEITAIPLLVVELHTQAPQQTDLRSDRARRMAL